MAKEMDPMYLPDVEAHDPPGELGDEIRQLRAAGIPIPQLLHLLAFKPDRTLPLTAFTQAALRGDSPLSPGQRELIAAFTSRHNQCLF